MNTTCILTFTMRLRSIPHPDRFRPRRSCNSLDSTTNVGPIGALLKSCKLRERLFPHLNSCYALLDRPAPLLLQLSSSAQA